MGEESVKRLMLMDLYQVTGQVLYDTPDTDGTSEKRDDQIIKAQRALIIAMDALATLVDMEDNPDATPYDSFDGKLPELPSPTIRTVDR